MKYYILNTINNKTRVIETESPLFLKKFASGYKTGMYYITRADGKSFDNEERQCLGLRQSYVKDDAIWIDEQLETSFTAEDLALSVADHNKIEYETIENYVYENIENLRCFDYASAYKMVCEALKETEVENHV